jgi:glycosyltransferase involved in cell wall biosynthesis
MVSIIIPCYNQGAYIQEAIDSVKAQTYAECEIIIVNDGSDDEETIQILVRLKDEGFQIIDIANSGVSAARNTGIAASKGEFVLPLDADDKIAPRYLEEAIKILEDKPEVKLVYCDCAYFGILTGISPVPAFSLEGMLSENLIFNAAVIRKADFIKSGGYDEDFLAGWEDWEFWLGFIKNEAEVYKLPFTFFYYRIKEDSRNSSIKDEKRKICEQQLYKKHIDLFLHQNPNPISSLKDLLFYKKEYESLGRYRQQLLQSVSYRIGNFILSPVKWFKRVFKNEQ